jgi:hypothetical protein
MENRFEDMRHASDRHFTVLTRLMGYEVPDAVYNMGIEMPRSRSPSMGTPIASR